MIERSTKTASAPGVEDDAAQAGLVPQLRAMFRALWNSPVRTWLLLLAAGLLLVILATAYAQVLLNQWNRPFYDALSRRELHTFFEQLGVFCLIAGSLLVLNVLQKWLGETLKVKLREGLIHDLIQDWMTPRRALALASAGPIGVNPDQRMHEDARHLTELSADLGIGLLQAAVLLASFIGVLWVISSGFVFHLAGRNLTIPGYMVWAALIYAGAGSLASYAVGRSLVARNAERYAREADLRVALVRVNEHLDAITLADGEAAAARHLEFELAAVLAAMKRIVTGLTNLTWITAGFGWSTLVAPILVAAPLYFAGSLSFGGLMMAAGAFTQAQSSLRWFVDNFSTLADWRATLLRVANFRRAVLSTDTLHPGEERISVTDGAPGRILIDNLALTSPSGTILLRERKVQIARGKRVLIVGGAGAGKTLMFRALAGLWPWGSGRIERPAGEEILYLGHAPYLPAGTLRELLAYPANAERFPSEHYRPALERLGLERLVTLLDTTHVWEQELSQDEQYRLAFARVLLHAPAWVVIDDVFARLEDETLKLVAQVFEQQLKTSAVIQFGRSQASDPLGSRVLHVECNTATRRLARRRINDAHPLQAIAPNAALSG
jgi:vitamin B12/bleomycin/antimicrobial peptide transport system ATP-binding/permease protein